MVSHKKNNYPRFLLFQYNASTERLDVLINNAGVMLLPKRVHTDDGFEMTIGTNHLGPFLLTNLLLEKLKESKPSRIVNVSSRAHEQGRMDLTDLSYAVKPWKSMEAYRQSKLVKNVVSDIFIDFLYIKNISNIYTLKI